MQLSTQEAYAILNITELDEATDAYEMRIFEYKQKYLQVIPPIRLIQSQIKKIDRLNAAIQHLEPLEESGVIESLSITWPNTLSAVLTHYNQVMMPLKLKIASAKTGIDLIAYLEELIALESGFYETLARYGNEVQYSDWDAVKLSSTPDIFEASKELSLKVAGESEIKDYLCNVISASTYPYESVLTNLILKSVKLVNNGYTRDL